MSNDNPGPSTPANLTGPAALPSCAADSIGALKAMFVDLTMGPRLNAGQKPAQRPVFRKTHGVAAGIFRVKPDLPEELKTGIFALGELPMLARFSTDDAPLNADDKATIGIGFKLLGVPGPKILHPQDLTCDFILQNHPVFFVDTARDMCEFTRAAFTGGFDAYLAAHPVTGQVLSAMEKVEPSVLTASYWSILPHKFGDGFVVKYKLTPRTPAGPLPGSNPPQNYLYLDLKDRLLRGEAIFDFHLQFQKDPAAMPIDQATVPWDETVSPPVPVATLTFPAQNIDAQAVFGENFSANIWQTLPVHEPLGSIADVRKVAYAAAAELRRTVNQVSTAEPASLPTAETPTPASMNIVRAAIYPPIGIARVGNSTAAGEEGFFIGPEVPDAPTLPQGRYKDAEGALKRQAARFRIYGFNEHDEVVAELTANNAAIDWQVHLANKKAAWYKFQLALDIPEALAADVPASSRRNPNIAGDDRRKLVIDPGPRTIHGRNTSGSDHHFANGKFFDLTVPLGELRTDADGRLLVLGGFGLSRSIDGSVPAPNEFANNDKWHDDTSDGPVDARVVVDGREIPVEGAWVVVGPPNYAPAIKTVRSLYDLLLDVMVTGGLATAPARVSFQQHIRPIFVHLANLQWVNNGFASIFGANAPYDFAKLESRLADPSPANLEFRTTIWKQFRDPNWPKQPNLGIHLWPPMYGDSLDRVWGVAGPDPTVSVPGSMAPLSALQLRWLAKWAQGDFDSDAAAPRPVSLDADVPLAQQPATLTQAALSYCLSDAFHPGCEVTWPMRHLALYSGAFRIRRHPAGYVEPDLGDVLTPAVAVATTGPLGSGPGDLTRWMAVPWQTDTASCLSGYSGFKTSQSLPTFWPARVPNQVLTAEMFEKIVMNPQVSPEERLRAFYTRKDWFRGFPGDDDVTRMITEFGKLGVVEERAGPTDLPGLPARVWVESKPDLPEPGSSGPGSGGGPAPGLLGAPAPDGAPAPASALALETTKKSSLPRRFTLRKFGFPRK